MKNIFLLLLLTVLFSNLACTSQKVKTNIIGSEGGESTSMEYTVELTSPEIVKKNTYFTIDSKFTNTKDSDIRIMHGEKLFTFYISNKNGDIINYYPITSLGVVRGIPKHGTIVEQYTFNIDNAGEYEVWAVANFDISDIKYELSTKKKVLVVR